MKKIFCVAMAMMLLATGCAGGVSNLTDGVRPAEPQQAEPQPEGEASYAGAAKFSLELMRRAAGDENVVISPASAYLCLAMVMNGAAGETLDEFAGVMGGGTDSVNAAARELIAALADTSGRTRMAVGNSAWADESANISEDFLKSIAASYGAEVFSAKLSSEAAVKAINKWVSDKTNGLIPTLHDKPYAAGTMLVLLNTIYMKAGWLTEFDGSATYEQNFTKPDGAAASVPFMHMKDDLAYISSEGVEGVVLPYDDGETAFVALRPTDGTAIELAKALDEGALSEYIAGAAQRKVALAMPKFTVEYSVNMNDMLKDMGLVTLFDPARADLSAMGSGANAELYIDQVFQKVKIEVNEEGTEAAAVTEAVACESAYIEEEPPVELTLDSPFIYAVIDLGSGLPLFIGILNDPA